MSVTYFTKAYVLKTNKVTLPDHSDAFVSPKNDSETKAVTITPPFIGQLKKRPSSCATDIVLH